MLAREKHHLWFTHSRKIELVYAVSWRQRGYR